MPAGGLTGHLQARLQFGLVADGESPQTGQKFRAVAREVWIGKVMIPAGVPDGVALVCGDWVDFPEAVQIELPDEAGEICSFKGVSIVQRDGAWRQNLPLKELLVDDDGFALAVPVDGFVCRVVHQTPQFGRKVVGVDAFRDWASSSIHASVSRIGNSDKRFTCRLTAS